MILERFKLDGKTAFVTGSGRGIGFEIARSLGQAGARVVVSDVRKDGSDEAARTLAAEGIDVSSVPLDVTDSSAVDAAAAAVGPVDVLVNNAGIGFQAKAVDMSDEDWRRVMEINTNAVFWCCRAFGRRMIERGRGSIVNIGSMSGFIINKPLQASHYMVSKAGVHHLTRALAVEWAEHNIRVNAVAPGSTVTEQTQSLRDHQETYDATIELTPMKRFAEPVEIAAAVVFLASDAASYCTGSVVTVDGGYTCW